MSDFMNFTIKSNPQNGGGYTVTIKHRDRKGVQASVSVPDMVDAKDFPALLRGAITAYEGAYSKTFRSSLTAKQKAFYESLLSFYSKEGRAPTYDEMMGFCGANSKGTPHGFIRRLIDRGWVWLDKQRQPVPVDIAFPRDTGYE